MSFGNEGVIDGNTRFYNALRNAQPIAFLASFGMVIHAFSFKGYTNLNIYTDAVVASVMFIISFSFSLFDQLKLKEEKDIRLIHWGKFFFLGIGMLYMAGIGFEFAKSIPQISDIFLSWTFILLGGSYLGTLIAKKEKRFFDFKPDTILFTLSSFSILLVGILFLGRQTLEHRFGEELFKNLLTYSFLVFVISILLGLLVIKIQKPKFVK